MNESERKATQSSVLIVGVGAWRGLGAALARRFASGGHGVVIAGHNVQRLEATAAKLKKSGVTV
jgi:NAD(P)-dependent dehydrogenase (short-subunit alcohol dehydrogenase family)